MKATICTLILFLSLILSSCISNVETTSTNLETQDVDNFISADEKLIPLSEIEKGGNY